MTLSSPYLCLALPLSTSPYLPMHTPPFPRHTFPSLTMPHHTFPNLSSPHLLTPPHPFTSLPQIHTPKLIGGASEGGSNVFKLNYFDQPACLAQSPQLYKQMACACGGLDRLVKQTYSIYTVQYSTAQDLSLQCSIFCYVVPHAALRSNADIWFGLPFILLHLISICPRIDYYFNSPYNQERNLCSIQLHLICLALSSYHLPC